MLPFSATSTFTSVVPAPTGPLASLKLSFANTTWTYFEGLSPRDVAYLPWRGLVRLDRFLVRKIPDYILEKSADLVAAAGNSVHSVFRSVGNVGEMADTAAQVAVGETGAVAAGTGWRSLVTEAFQTSTFKSYFGMISYLTSRWAFSCFGLALILNRVQIYASTRQRIFLTWEKRLALRLIPILLFITQIHHLLQAIRCQSSPEFSLYRHGDINKYSLLDWAPEGGFSYKLSSTILRGSTDEDACAAVGMSRPSPEIRAPYGSFSLLWPTFMRLCLSHLIETISCHLQQLQPMTEIGMSIFEHSLAFSEAETMISHALGLGLFGPSKTTATTHNSTNKATTIPPAGTLLAISDATKSLTGPHLMDRINVPVEILLVALLSCCNALTSNLVALFNKQRSLRLINTGFWGMCFMTAFVWGFFSTSIMVRVGRNGESEDMRTVSGLLHFPTVAIIGFLPHILIILAIIVCAVIYLVALALTALSLNTNPALRHPVNLIDRVKIAHENLQAAIQVRGINIRWYEDFYTALLRIGFAVLTAASEAVFLNEGRSVEMRQLTWLEEDRLDEIESSRASHSFSQSSHFQIAEDYGLPNAGPGTTDSTDGWRSGYSKERKLENDKDSSKSKSTSIIYPNPRTGGVGALQRTTRFWLLFLYLRGVVFLIGGYIAFGIGKFLDWLGITTRPPWLRSIIGRSLKQAKLERSRMRGRHDDTRVELDFWFMDEDGRASVPRSLDTDIEPEMRRRLALVYSGKELDEAVDQSMYDWWKGNGWYGTRDDSGSYQPSQMDDFDATSAISVSSATSTTGDEDGWESESDGQRTPTQHSSAPSLSFSRRSRSTTPASEMAFTDTPLDPAALARLLNPQDRAAREEARMLASHFTASASSNRIMTRSRYRHELESERARVLLAGRGRPNQSNGPLLAVTEASSHNHENRPLTPAEEAEVLESLIISRRRNRPQLKHSPSAFFSPSIGRATATPPSPPSPQPTLFDPSYHPGEQSEEALLQTPPCVVCQSSPRTIITWPCRCLCVCEDCRVNLALNNFSNCVTCRRSVGGFVRLWVP